MAYKNDRSYTDNIHNTIDKDIIYREMEWTQQEVNQEFAELSDRTQGIDYTVQNKDGETILLQERFRKNTPWTDFTLRYERPESNTEIEKLSEFFKIKARLKRDRYGKKFYMVYGIVNENEDGFFRYAVIDLRALYRHIERREINLDSHSKRSYIKDGKMFCGFNANPDKSSNFVCFDIKQLSKLFSDVIVHSYNF